jgi:hypothetical protein
MKFLILISALLWVTPCRAQGQSPPVPVEILLGDKRLAFQAVITKRFSPESGFGFFSIATYMASYRNDLNQNELAIPVQFNYTFWKGLGVMAGATMNGRAGFHPIVGPQYIHAGKKVLAVVVPSFFLTSGYNFEFFSLLEYKPMLSEKWGVYSRVQSLYSQNMQRDIHERSYFYLRLGFRRQAAAFGLGGNWDYYGPDKTMKENYGVFLRWEFR